MTLREAPWRLILATAALGFAVRIAYVLVQSRLQIFDVTFVASDSLLYLRLARAIASGEGMSLDGEPTAYVGAGYPLFLAPLVALGADATAIGAVQSIVGAIGVAAAALASWLLARRISPGRARVAAVVAGAAAAVYPHLVFWTGYVLTETLFVVLLGAGVALLIWAWQEHRWEPAVAAGLCFGYAAITRPPALAIVIGLAAWWLYFAVRSRWRFVPVAAFVLGAALPVGAWTVRNVIELGTPVVTSAEAGYVFYQGNSRTSTGGSRGYVDSLDFRPLDLPEGLSELERDRIYLNQALADIRADPLHPISLWPAKLWNMWRPTYEGASFRNGLVTFLTYPVVLVAGIVGAVRLVRAAPGSAGMVPGLFLIGWVLLHVFITGMIRFRVAAEHVLIVAAPFAVLWMWDWIRARQRA